MDYGRPGGRKVAQWKCHECGKCLSSKRSYKEHKNIHNKERPHQCEHCDYAAASQMTLRRHNLRAHTSREEWGYPCPYCSETYMEPASYQQHVFHRHFGKSCTFGCPHPNCTFTSKSSKSFFDHVAKHLHRIASFATGDLYIDGKVNVNADVVQFLVDDHIGTGYGKPPAQAEIHRYDNVLDLTDQKNIPGIRKRTQRKSSRNDMKRAVTDDRRVLNHEDVNEEYQNVCYQPDEDSQYSQFTYEDDGSVLHEMTMNGHENGMDDRGAIYQVMTENGLEEYYYAAEDDYIEPSESLDYQTEDGMTDFFEEDGCGDLDLFEKQQLSSPVFSISPPNHAPLTGAAMVVAGSNKRQLPDGQVDLDLD